MEQPVYYWDPVIAPSGMLFYTGDAFPDWKGSVFIGSSALHLDRRVGEENVAGLTGADRHRRLEERRLPLSVGFAPPRARP